MTCFRPARPGPRPPSPGRGLLTFSHSEPFQSWDLCLKLGAPLHTMCSRLGKGGPPPSPSRGWSLTTACGRWALTLVWPFSLDVSLWAALSTEWEPRREAGPGGDGPLEPRALWRGRFTYHDISEEAVRAKAAARAWSAALNWYSSSLPGKEATAGSGWGSLSLGLQLPTSAPATSRRGCAFLLSLGSQEAGLCLPPQTRDPRGRAVAGRGP